MASSAPTRVVGEPVVTPTHPLTPSRLLRTLCALLALVAVSLGSLGGVRTAHDFSPTRAFGIAGGASGPAGSAPAHVHVHVHPELGPQASREARRPDSRSHGSSPGSSDRLAQAREALLVLLLALRPRSCLPATAARVRRPRRLSQAQLCTYRI